MKNTSNSDCTHCTIVVSLEMSDEPNFVTKIATYCDKIGLCIKNVAYFNKDYKDDFIKFIGRRMLGTTGVVMSGYIKRMPAYTGS